MTNTVAKQEKKAVLANIAAAHASDLQFTAARERAWLRVLEMVRGGRICTLNGSLPFKMCATDIPNFTKSLMVVRDVKAISSIINHSPDPQTLAPVLARAAAGLMEWLEALEVSKT